MSVSLDDNPDLSNIQPLVDNPDLGEGVRVGLNNTSVSCDDVALLEAKGVRVVHNRSIDTCKVEIMSGTTEYFDATHEACEILILGPDFIAADGSNISASSGWEIDFTPGFFIEQGATLNANVCGQSLCMISDYPMPYGRHSCVDLICDIDPSCCALEFDQACLDKVDTVCNLVCE